MPKRRKKGKRHASSTTGPKNPAAAAPPPLVSAKPSLPPAGSPGQPRSNGLVEIRVAEGGAADSTDDAAALQVAIDQATALRVLVGPGNTKDDAVVVAEFQTQLGVTCDAIYRVRSPESLAALIEAKVQSKLSGAFLGFCQCLDCCLRDSQRPDERNSMYQKRRAELVALFRAVCLNYYNLCVHLDPKMGVMNFYETFCLLGASHQPLVIGRLHFDECQEFADQVLVQIQRGAMVALERSQRDPLVVGFVISVLARYQQSPMYVQYFPRFLAQISGVLSSLYTLLPAYWQCAPLALSQDMMEIMFSALGYQLGTGIGDRVLLEHKWNATKACAGLVSAWVACLDTLLAHFRARKFDIIDIVATREPVQHAFVKAKLALQYVLTKSLSLPHGVKREALVQALQAAVALFLQAQIDENNLKLDWKQLPLNQKEDNQAVVFVMLGYVWILSAKHKMPLSRELTKQMTVFFDQLKDLIRKAFTLEEATLVTQLDAFAKRNVILSFAVRVLSYDVMHQLKPRTKLTELRDLMACLLKMPEMAASPDLSPYLTAYKAMLERMLGDILSRVIKPLSEVSHALVLMPIMLLAAKQPVAEVKQIYYQNPVSYGIGLLKQAGLPNYLRVELLALLQRMAAIFYEVSESLFKPFFPDIVKVRQTDPWIAQLAELEKAMPSARELMQPCRITLADDAALICEVPIDDAHPCRQALGASLRYRLPLAELRRLDDYRMPVTYRWVYETEAAVCSFYVHDADGQVHQVAQHRVVMASTEKLAVIQLAEQLRTEVETQPLLQTVLAIQALNTALLALDMPLRAQVNAYLIKGGQFALDELPDKLFKVKALADSSKMYQRLLQAKPMARGSALFSLVETLQTALPKAWGDQRYWAMCLLADVIALNMPGLVGWRNQAEIAQAAQVQVIAAINEGRVLEHVPLLVFYQLRWQLLQQVGAVEGLSAVEDLLSERDDAASLLVGVLVHTLTKGVSRSAKLADALAMGKVLQALMRSGVDVSQLSACQIAVEALLPGLRARGWSAHEVFDWQLQLNCLFAVVRGEPLVTCFNELNFQQKQWAQLPRYVFFNQQVGRLSRELSLSDWQLLYRYFADDSAEVVGDEGGMALPFWAQLLVCAPKPAMSPALLLTKVDELPEDWRAASAAAGVDLERVLAPRLTDVAHQEAKRALGEAAGWYQLVNVDGAWMAQLQSAYQLYWPDAKTLLRPGEAPAKVAAVLATKDAVYNLLALLPREHEDLALLLAVLEFLRQLPSGSEVTCQIVGSGAIAWAQRQAGMLSTYLLGDLDLKIIVPDAHLSVILSQLKQQFGGETPRYAETHQLQLPGMDVNVLSSSSAAYYDVLPPGQGRVVIDLVRGTLKLEEDERFVALCQTWGGVNDWLEVEMLVSMLNLRRVIKYMAKGFLLSATDQFDQHIYRSLVRALTDTSINLSIQLKHMMLPAYIDAAQQLGVFRVLMQFLLNRIGIVPDADQWRILVVQFERLLPWIKAAPDAEVCWSRFDAAWRGVFQANDVPLKRCSSGNLFVALQPLVVDPAVAASSEACQQIGQAVYASVHPSVGLFAPRACASMPEIKGLGDPGWRFRCPTATVVSPVGAGAGAGSGAGGWDRSSPTPV